ncbi:MAG: DUF3846 domain-containing protein [Clostridia bacterium]|nr:DUF3846 domain-containing protein [Clostridia bacterium]
MGEVKQKENVKIKVLVVRPGERPFETEIDRNLESMQELVGGYIEQVCPFNDDVSLICNEEGKIYGLTPNRALRTEEGEIFDVIAGTFFIAYSPSDSENFESLPDDLSKKYTEYFKYPECIVFKDGKIKALKIYAEEESNAS